MGHACLSPLRTMSWVLSLARIMGDTVVPSDKSSYPFIISIGYHDWPPLNLTWMSHHQLLVAILSQHWFMPLSLSYKWYGVYFMYSLNSGLLINSWTHLTGFRCHNSTISVLGAPLSSTMSPTTSRISQVHSGPDGRASIFWRRDRVLWNDVHLAFRI